MPESHEQDLVAIAARHEAQITNLREDLNNIAASIKDLIESTKSEFVTLRTAIEHRQNNSRNMVISVLGIMVPVSLAMGGALWGLINSNTHDIKALALTNEQKHVQLEAQFAQRITELRTALNRTREEIAYSKGKREGQYIMLQKQIDQLVEEKK